MGHFGVNICTEFIESCYSYKKMREQKRFDCANDSNYQHNSHA